MKYDIIVIGAGAAGLFAAANIRSDRHGFQGLILNKAGKPGLKLLMSGAGQCNVTHAGDIREFVTHYGPAGKKVRSVLYSLSSEAVCSWFGQRGVPLKDRGDGKIFPETLSSKDVLQVLLEECRRNGFQLVNQASVSEIVPPAGGEDAGSEIVHHAGREEWFLIRTEDGAEYRARKVIVAAGGCSYPTTGSDGSIFSCLKDLGHSINEPRPSLVPLHVENYPYTALSGNSVRSAVVSIFPGKQKTKKAPSMQKDVLMTHRNFSGPGILDMSRYAHNGHTLEINWYAEKTAEQIYAEINELKSGSRKLLVTVLNEYFRPRLSEAHLALLMERAGISGSIRLADVKGADLKTLIRLITADSFVISGTSGFNTAMCTTGGVSLSEINMKTMESKLVPGLFILGETLDVDGDTGGYNIHFAFASAQAASSALTK